MKKWPEPKFLIRSDEDYYEFNLNYCGRMIANFKKWYFRKNSKRRARIYAKLRHPHDCPTKWWMHYLVTEVDCKPYEITSITKEAFDVLTRGIEPTCYQENDIYEIAVHELKKDLNEKVATFSSTI